MTTKQTVPHVNELFPYHDQFDIFKNCCFQNRYRYLELEIGCGRGLYALARAQRNPDVMIIAVEMFGSFLRLTEMNRRKLQIPNLTLIRGDITLLLKELDSSPTFSGIHIYFPDPWPKRRHTSRRYLTYPFFQRLYQLLKPQAFLHIGSDHLDYYRHIHQHLLQAQCPWNHLMESHYRFIDSHFKTRFETKYTHEGRIFRFIEARK